MEKNRILFAIKQTKKELIECLTKINVLYDVINGVSFGDIDLDNPYYKRTQELINYYWKQKQTLEFKVVELEKALENWENSNEN